MPKDAEMNLQGCLRSLEELQNVPDDEVYSTTFKNHLNLLKSLYTVFNGNEVSKKDADRILCICLRYMTDVRCVPYVFSIISTLIAIYKDNPLVDFLPFALAILEFLRTKCIEVNTNNLRIMPFQMLMSQPQSTLIKLVRDHCSTLISTFGLFRGLRNAEDMDSKMESFTLLQMLEWLPAQEKTQFVKQGIPLWFSHVMPSMIQILMVAEDENKIEACLKYVELLSDELVHQDYFENPEWRSLLECIVDPKKFPICIKSLLDKGKDNWHRIWIVLIKLLKTQVTRNYNAYGSPINSMLPVVESAFKKDCIQRVRAFECWNALILNFSKETNANCISKRVKLLIIPLRLNNAKTKVTAVAKFNTWWILIQKFVPKINQFTNEILKPFLQFMFGKNEARQSFQAIQVSNSMRKKCLEAFTEIMGHLDCTSCPITDLTPLDGKITNIGLLTDHWKDFVYALKCSIVAAALSNTVETKVNIQCIWNSFVLRLAELAENTLRQDVFNDLINMVSDLISDHKPDGEDHLMEILVDVITLTLFRNSKLETLVKSRSEAHRPMHKLLKLIMGDKLDSYYKRYNLRDLSTLLQPLINALIEEAVTTPAYMIWLMDDLSATDNTLRLWTTLAQACIETDLPMQALSSILRWPFKTVYASYELKDAALAWYTLYNTVHPKLQKTGFDDEICKVLIRPVEDSKSTNYFVMFALIGVLKHNPDETKMAKLEALTYEMNDCKDFEQLMAPLVDTIVLMIDNSNVQNDENLDQITINCVENVLKVMKSESRAKSKSPIKSKEPTISNLNGQIPAKNITSTLKTYFTRCPNESIRKQVRLLITEFEELEKQQNSESPTKTDIPPKQFLSPKIQVKKNKKKEASIVNTVVENGEEYVVVKSNWKFNPKNLTENQKEKFQRKRDIPALYQDLSQSQDELKLTSWKTDSQDTSLSSSKSSKSTTSDNNSEILRKMPSTNVVPKIMENILVGDKNYTPIIDANASPTAKQKTPKVDKSSTPIGTKSPHMALKDRVFRNVRNLIEKSSPQNKVTDKEDTNTEVLYSVAPVPKATDLKQNNGDMLAKDKQENQNPVVSTSPDVRMKKAMVVTAKQNDKNITFICTPDSKQQKELNMLQSASTSSADRPARMKRKPKKFDDSLLFALKKSRHSEYDTLLDSQDSLEFHSEITIAQIHTPNHKNDNTNKDVSHEVDLIKENDKISLLNGKTVTNDEVIVLDDEMDYVTSNQKTHCDSSKIEEMSLILPKTPIDKSIEKSPEKPTTGVVPSSKSKASEGMDNDAVKSRSENNVKELPPVNTYVDKPKEQQNISITNESFQNEAKTDDNITVTPNMSLKKLRRTKVQTENSGNDQKTAINSLVNTIKDLNKKKSSAKKKAFINSSNKHEETLGTPITPIHKTKKDIETNHPKSVEKIDLLKKSNDNDHQFETVTSFIQTKDVTQDKLTLKEDDDVEIENRRNKNEEKLITPKAKKDATQTSKVEKKKSRIEKELMIDMVEGHPFLKAQSEKRRTRKNLTEAENNNRRKTLVDKLDKSKIEGTPKTSKKPKEKKTSPTVNTVTVQESQDRPESSSPENMMDEPPCSEDVIESSQDSTMTTISVKSTKRTPKRQAVVALKKNVFTTMQTQDLLEGCEMINKPDKENHENTDIELPQNKTAEADKDITDLTEDMDTEPIGATRNTTDLTENMDTEPLASNNSGDAISVKSTKRTPKRQPVVALEKLVLTTMQTQDLPEGCEMLNKPDKENHENTDIKLPQNKTAEADKDITDHTEDMDTEPIGATRNTTDLTENMDTEPLASNNSGDAICVKSTKRTPKRQPVVALEKLVLTTMQTQDLPEGCEMLNKPDKENHENTDIELPQNKTAEADKDIIDLTEDMDTEPIGDTRNTTDLTENMDTEPLASNSSGDVIILNETIPTPITVSSESENVVGPETQELADADTQPNDPKEIEQFEVLDTANTYEASTKSSNRNPPKPTEIECNGITQNFPEAALILANMSNTTNVSSPFKDDNQRKQDFLNNTIEISPIKVQSPDREKKSPSPETSRDFVVIKLSSPVQSNGERFEKQGSPEFFTEDKVSPDKRNASPPRVEVTVSNASPSSTLSLKKNRPQVRPSGRAAHMLGLLSVHSDLKITKLPEPEEIKKANTSTPARRNLRVLYSAVNENNDNTVEQNAGEEENFLKLQRSLPTVTSSPSGPILKRKLVEITDEATATPASKRKRVSFHDPPVSTSISVQKYLEPLSLLRSPQSSAKKRSERQTRSGLKSPKRLDNAFLDSALSKTLESFVEPAIPSDDTENISLDVTPAVEIVKTSELNDTEPICPDLVDCMDPIKVIATELSSPAMRELFIKELKGKVETVGDLAKMTELDVNRLCIKAPKINVAKKVLTDYMTNRPAIAVETIIEEAFSEPMTESLLSEIKTNDGEMQTDKVDVRSNLMQTEIVVTANSSMQTDEPDKNTTENIIDSCMAEREDFFEKVADKLNEEQLKTIAEKLSRKSLFNLIMKRSEDSSTTLLNKLLKHQSKGSAKDKKTNSELSFVRDYLCESYDSKNLILLCSQILQKVHDKP